MKKSLTAFQEKPSNKHLKNIYFGFTAVTRGVEGFNNFDLETRFRNVANGIYAIQDELKQNIKW